MQRVTPQGHVKLILFRPAGIAHIGDVGSDITRARHNWIDPEPPVVLAHRGRASFVAGSAHGVGAEEIRTNEGPSHVPKEAVCLAVVEPHLHRVRGQLEFVMIAAVRREELWAGTTTGRPRKDER